MMNNRPKNSAKPSSQQQAAIDSKAQDWFLLMATGEPSQQDRLKFHEWLDFHPQHQLAYDELNELWADIGDLRDAFATPAEPKTKASDFPSAKKSTEAVTPQHRRGPSERALRKLLACKHDSRKRRNVLWSGSVAACLALVIINTSNLTSRWMADHHTAVGEQAQVELPDGSIAWLNTDTAIDVRYSEGQREIILLQGEAQFDVQKNPSRPFVVTAKQGQSTALGTIYSVRKQDDAVWVTVTGGRVEVASPAKQANANSGHKSDPSRVVLEHGEQTHYTEGNVPSLAQKTHIHSELAWRQGFIAIRCFMGIYV